MLYGESLIPSTGKGEKMRIEFDNRPNFEGLWLKGVVINIFGIGLRIQFFNYKKYV